MEKSAVPSMHAAQVLQQRPLRYYLDFFTKSRHEDLSSKSPFDL